MYVLGIDVGTQGARTVVCDPDGRIVAQAENPFPRGDVALPRGWSEQSPPSWWRAVLVCLRAVSQGMREGGRDVSALAGISVTSTSGTLVALDVSGEALGNAIMYNDGRAREEAAVVGEAGAAQALKLGYRFSSSYGLPKILWLQRHDADRFEATARFASPTDYVIGKLTGEFGVSDFTNVLKMGYDLLDERWPAFIEDELGISHERLPRVSPPGTVVGGLLDDIAEKTGLPAGVPVLTGMTDGCASQVSTGAVAPGQWSSTLGTTLVIKGVSRELIRDPLGRVYCHRHPDGHWLPGGASNVGGDCIARRFDSSDLDGLNAAALDRSSTGVIAYPLETAGERFPFSRPEATGFLLGDASDRATHYAACLEGVAYVERMAYEVLELLGAEVGPIIYAAGGGTRSAPWCQIRSDVLGRALKVPAQSGGAMGAAIIAAGGTLYPGVVPAAESMVRLDAEYEPRSGMMPAYDERYQRFRAECARRGYID